MENKKSRKPSLFAETKDSGQKKAGVLAGIETGVENNHSATSKVLLLLAIIPLLVWLSYIAISNVSIPETYSGGILSGNQKDKPIKQAETTLQQEDEITVAEAKQSEGIAKIIDEPLPTEEKGNDEDMVSTAFDALDTNPEESKEPVTARPKPKQAKAKRKKTSTNKQTTAKTQAEAGDIAVLQALLEYKKVPTKSEAETQTEQSTTTESLISVTEETNHVEQAAPKQQVALAPSTTSSISPTPQQALLSNGLNNQELAATAGANNNSTMLDSTKALLKKCDAMDELDAAICKWDVCDQYGGDESMCSKAFTKKKEKEKSRFNFLKYLGLD